MSLTQAPWGDEPLFDWDEQNENKIWDKHQVTVFEVGEVFEGRHIIAPHRDPSKGSRYIVFGYTKNLRDLQVIVQHKGGSLIRVITAYGPRERG